MSSPTLLLLFSRQNTEEPVDPPVEKTVPVVGLFDDVELSGLFDGGPLSFYFCDIDVEQGSEFLVTVFPNTVNIIVDSSPLCRATFSLSNEVSISLSSKPAVNFSFVKQEDDVSIFVNNNSLASMLFLNDKSVLFFDMILNSENSARAVLVGDNKSTSPVLSEEDWEFRCIDFIV